MKFSLPSFLNSNAFSKVERFSRPILFLMIITNFVVRALQFGKYNNDYDILYSLVGAFLFEVVIFGSFFLLNGRNLAQFSRLQILYIAFVSNIKYSYLERIVNISVAFEIRDNVSKGKWPAAIALWYPEASRIIQVIIPFLLLLIMAAQINKSIGNLNFKYPKWYVIIGGIGIFLLLVTFPFANLTNLCIYLCKFFFVLIIWDLWEKIRKNRSLEPMIMVSWAEIILFLALWLKALVENLL